MTDIERIKNSQTIETGGIDLTNEGIFANNLVGANTDFAPRTERLNALKKAILNKLV